MREDCEITAKLSESGLIFLQPTVEGFLILLVGLRSRYRTERRSKPSIGSVPSLPQICSVLSPNSFGFTLGPIATSEPDEYLHTRPRGNVLRYLRRSSNLVV